MLPHGRTDNLWSSVVQGFDDQVPTMHSMGGAPRVRNSPQTYGVHGTRTSADVELFISTAQAPTAHFVMLENGGGRVEGDLWEIVRKMTEEVADLRVRDASQTSEIAALQSRMQALEKGMKLSRVPLTVIPEEGVSEPGGCGEEADEAGCPLWRPVACRDTLQLHPSRNTI